MRTLRAASFLIRAPFLLALLFLINLVTSPHHWWIQWPALGIGIAWVICLIRVCCAVAIAGGLAALIAVLCKKPAFDAIRRKLG